MTFEEKVWKIREYAAAYLERAERERRFGDREKAAVLLKDGLRLKEWADRMSGCLNPVTESVRVSFQLKP